MVVTRSIAEGIRSGDLTLGGPGGTGQSSPTNNINVSFAGAEFVGMSDDMIQEIETKLIEKLNIIGGGLQLVPT
jgi:hypothetical protein